MPLLSPDGRAIFLMMFKTYRSLLNAIEARGFDVFSERISIGRWSKLGLMLNAFAIKWGWEGSGA